MATRSYQFAAGFRLKDLNANAVGAELERIAAADGVLSPRVVWMRSRNRTALFHEHFIWDDAKAGKLYRDEQARYLIRSVRVIIDDRPPVRAFYHITAEESQYVSLDRALTTGEILAEIVDEAISYLDAAREKLGEIEALKAEAATVARVLASARKKRADFRKPGRSPRGGDEPRPSAPR